MIRRTCLVVATLLAVSCGTDETSPVDPTPDAGTGIPPECNRTEDPLPAPAAHTPRWAFEPWISKDISDRADTYAFVDGFRERGIPVGAVVLDSPWETHYNTFVPSPTRYADFPGMVKDMHDRSVKVVLWITQMTNETGIDFEAGGDFYPGPAANFEEGQKCKYFTDDGATFVWWKGRGSAVDFFNPSAQAWWHAQQDTVLDAGIDGWKLDFGETYMRKDTVLTAQGDKPFQEYSEKYYEDYLRYGQKKRGKEFVTMVRAYDKSYEFPGRFFAKKEHAPVAWMGDNLRNWDGLEDALDHTFRSAIAGYHVLGSDIGGYLDRTDENLLSKPLPFDTLNFARWIAVGAMSPFMQLHGRANLTPWTVPDNVDETIAVYKYWATLHHELVPFFFDLAEESWAGGKVPLAPVSTDEASWAKDWRYVLGDAFLVAPIVDETGIRDVPLPAGTRWYDWWTTTVHDGGTTVAADYSADRAKIPLFVKEGAIVPMKVDADADAWTVLVYPGPTKTSFRHREDDDAITTIDAQDDTTTVAVDVSSAKKNLALRVRMAVAPASVTDGATPLTQQADVAALTAAGTGWTFEAVTGLVHVRVPARAGAVNVVVTR